ncbi:hypothetical protein FOZ61_001967, partial [Perkinsus olseni]
LVDLLNELEVKLDTSKGRLKEFSDLPSLPLSTIDSIAPNPSPPPLLKTSQPLGLPPAFQDFQNFSHRSLTLTTPSITRQFTNPSTSQYLSSTCTGSFVPPPTANILSASLQPFDVLTRSTMLMLDQQASPGSWIPRAPPPTLYGNILHWHLGRLVAVIRGLQSTVLSAALRDLRKLVGLANLEIFELKLRKSAAIEYPLRYDGWNEKGGAKLKHERLARIFEDGRLKRRIDERRRRDDLRRHVNNGGTLDIYLARNTLDQHSTHLLCSAFRLIADLKVIIAEGAAMAVGKNTNGWTRAREVEYPAAAQMIRNVISSSVQRQLRSALRNLYRKARGGRLQATLRITKVPPQQHVESEIDGDGESVSPARGLGGGKGSTFLSESSLDVLDGGGTSPRTDEGTSVDMSDYETSEDLGDEGGLIQPVYSRTLQASQKMSIGNAFPWSDEV